MNNLAPLVGIYSNNIQIPFANLYLDNFALAMYTAWATCEDANAVSELCYRYFPEIWYYEAKPQSLPAGASISELYCCLDTGEIQDAINLINNLVLPYINNLPDLSKKVISEFNSITAFYEHLSAYKYLKFSILKWDWDFDADYSEIKEFFQKSEAIFAESLTTNEAYIVPVD